jgi:hypothetical protein
VALRTQTTGVGSGNPSLQLFQPRSPTADLTVASSPERPSDAAIADRKSMVLFSVRTPGFSEIRCDDRQCQLGLRKDLTLLRAQIFAHDHLASFLVLNGRFRSVRPQADGDVACALRPPIG